MGFSMMFLMYVFIVVYIFGVGELLVFSINNWFGVMFLFVVGVLLFIFVVGGVVCVGILLVDFFNCFLFSVKIIFLVIMFVLFMLYIYKVNFFMFFL